MAEGLTITRTFKTTPSQVFEAWTKPEHFSFWFGSEAIEVPLDTVKMDTRPGGSWSAVMLLPDGTTKSWLGKYLEVDEPDKLMLTLSDNPSSTTSETVTVSLTEMEGGTEMVMKQSGGNLSEGQYQAAQLGYNTFFDSMDKLFV
jgi:uncharacterized protein YndB with AHSA1/START domain